MKRLFWLCLLFLWFSEHRCLILPVLLVYLELYFVFCLAFGVSFSGFGLPQASQR